MRILGIETSFDDIGVAVYDSNDGLLINTVKSQSIHKKYGGVVPELAAREYIYQVTPLIKNVLINSKISYNTLDGIAYTSGPGLLGSLMVGASISCALAYACSIPSIPINHMEAHLLSPMINNNDIQFPFIALLISGKHTQLISAYNFGKYKLLGETLDDAVGETFDKIAKELKLGYPGGAKLSQFAKNGRLGILKFPKPMKYHMNFNFSFSGLKTFTLNLLRSKKHSLQSLYDIACNFEDSIFDVLIYKSIQALKKTGFKRLIVAGGVSANIKFMNRLKTALQKKKYHVYSPHQKFCTDNAAMVAYAGMIYFKKKTSIDIIVRSKWSMFNI